LWLIPIGLLEFNRRKEKITRRLLFLALLSQHVQSKSILCTLLLHFIPRPSHHLRQGEKAQASKVERGERGGDTSNNTTRERRKVKHQQPGVRFTVLRMRGEENTKGPVEIWPN